MDKQVYQTVLLAGLLHDFGKFLVKPLLSSREHERLGIEYWLSRRAALAKIGVDTDMLLALIGSESDRPIWKIVKDADGVASGEREPKAKGAHDPLLAKSAYYTLDCIFSKVRLKQDLPVTRRYVHAPLSFESDWNIFPTREGLPKETEQPEIQKEIKNLQEQFDKELQSLLDSLSSENTGTEQGWDFRHFYITLTSLFQRYLWCIPSDTLQEREQEIRDVSLFDHSRLASAAAGCLYLFHDATQTLENLAAIADRTTAKYLLISGDLSGIQNYLYEIATTGTGGAARRLRARSFYLTALVEVIAQRALSTLVPDAELPIACKVLAAGGRFTLLAPNLPQVRANLETLEGQINRWLRTEFQGELAFTFAPIELTGKDFVIESVRRNAPSTITQKLTGLDDELAARKTHKLASALMQDASWNEDAFAWKWPQEGQVSACASCRKFPAFKTDSQTDARLCDHCAKDKAFGKELADAEWVAYFRGEIPAGANILNFFDANDIYSIGVYAKLPQTFSVKPFLVEKIGHQSGDLAAVNAPIAEHFVANYVARDQNNEVLDFEDIAKQSDGEELLGVLKADVDRLGMIFAMGLENASLSRLATMSRMLDLFFGGWINYALATDFRDCYTVYSGGDDLLIVGPWTQVVNFAQVLADHFAKFTGYNLNVTLSAGIVVTKPKFPIAKSAWLAGEFVKKAKEEHAALHLFGVTAKWGDELNQLLGTKEETAPVSRGEPSPADTKLGYGAFLYQQSRRVKEGEKAGDLQSKRGVLYRLLQYSEMCTRYYSLATKSKDPRDLLYSSHLVYDIARNVRKMEKNEITNKEVVANEEVVEKLERLARSEGRETMRKLRLPLTWALLKLRKEN